MPGVSVESVRVAWPPTIGTAGYDVAPALKVTVPVGAPLPGATAETVAVKVILWP